MPNRKQPPESPLVIGVDVGTGNLVCSYVEELKAPALIMTNEDDPQQILLMSKIQLDDIYERQNFLPIAPSRNFSPRIRAHHKKNLRVG